MASAMKRLEDIIMGNKREAEGGKKQTIPLRPCSPPAGRPQQKGIQPAGSDGWLCRGTQWQAQACHQRCSWPSTEKTKLKSDLREADLIKVTANGRAACGLHFLPSTRDKALKYCSRRKTQENYFGRMLKGGEVWGGGGDNRDVFAQ